MDLKPTLQGMDPENDDHWTTDGLPRIDVVNKLTGLHLKRADITDADPEFTRDSHRAALAQQTGVDEAEEQAGGGQELPEEPTRPGGGGEDGEPSSEADEAEVGQVDMADQEYLESLTPSQVMVDRETAEAYLQHATDICNSLSKQITEAKEKMDDWARRSELVSRQLQRLNKRDPNEAMGPIQQYLARQRQNRHDRAKRAAQFFERSGIEDVQVVKDQLQGASRLDRALNQRKPERGSKRPGADLPVQTKSITQ